MANIVAMNMKRKEHEVANHGVSIFLDPKRLKLQDGEVPEMMEEEKPSLSSVGVPTATVPIMVSWLLPPQGQEAVNTACGMAMASSSEPPFSAGQAAAAPMDVEVDLLRQRQTQAPPCQQPPFWSGFF